MSGQRIIDALKQAVAGDLARVTIDGQVWTRGERWKPVESAPENEDVLLGWWRTFPDRQWMQEVDMAICTKGGWKHGQATHWMPLSDPPGPA